MEVFEFLDLCFSLRGLIRTVGGMVIWSRDSGRGRGMSIGGVGVWGVFWGG